MNHAIGLRPRVLAATATTMLSPIHQKKIAIIMVSHSRAAEQQRSAGHRADFERERERADHMVTIQDRLIAELENLRSLLEAAQQSVRPVTPRTWREMTWHERWRWLRT